MPEPTAHTLASLSIINTRAQTQSNSLTESLSLLGANVIESPAIAFVAPDDESLIVKAVSEIADFDWLIFTSVNAVEHFFEFLSIGGKGVNDISGRIASVGKATSASLEARDLNIDLIAKGQATAEGLVSAFDDLFEGTGMQGLKFLMPRAQEAREILPVWLEEQGAEIIVAPVYKTISVGLSDEAFKFLRTESIGERAVIFTSPSTFKSFVASLEENGFDLEVVAAELVAFSVGPVTTAAMHKCGIAFKDLIESRESYFESLIEAIKEYYFL